MIAATEPRAARLVASRLDGQRLNVLLIQPWIRMGGAELISVYLADELGKLGHRVVIVCGFRDLNGMPIQAESLEYRTPPRWLSKLLERSRLAFLTLAPIVLLVLTWRYSKDVDLLNPHNAPAVWIAVLIGALRRKPIVWTCNEPPAPVSLVDASRIGFADYLGWLLMSSWIDRFVVRGVDAVYVPSQMTRKQVRVRYGIDPHVIGLGVDLEFFQRAGPNGTSLNGQLDDKYVLLAVGKLHPQKNQRVCMEALLEIMPAIPNAVLVLAGDGPMRPELENLSRRWGIQEHVLFLGHTSAHVVRDLYHACDLNLVSAVNQSWGLTPFEALCAGKVSVISNDSGAAEILRQEEIGIVTDPLGPAFAQAILHVRSNPTKAHEAAAKGISYVRQHLSWSAYSARVLSIFAKVAHNTI